MLGKNNYQKVASVFALIEPYFRVCVDNAGKHIGFLSVCQLQR